MSLELVKQRTEALVRAWRADVAVQMKQYMEHDAAEEASADARAALLAAQEIATAIQRDAHAQVTAIVSRCLTAVFQDPYEFEIIFERKGGRTEAQLVFKRGGNTIDPMRGSGGGVVDIAAFALRIAALVLSKPQKRRLLVLDEPFRFVSVQLRPAVKQLLDELASDLGVQILMITHVAELETGTVHHID
jgi:DNA repair exonuclease SbcCD ATPase subunit